MKKLCAGMALMPIGVTAAMAQQKPNILVIVADDMARCELGCYCQSSAMIVRYPGHVEAGSTSDALVQYEDILPTLIEAAAGGMHDQYGSGLYDMQGRLLSTAPLSGLYITGGKKVGIK